MKRTKDQAKFSQLMKGLAGVFDSKATLSPVKIELYFKALGDLTIEQIEKSAGELIRDRQFPSIPLPADIRRNISTAQLTNSLAAWLFVENYLEGGPKPGDPVTNKAVDGMGGYFRLGLLPYAELVWVQKEFDRRYELLNQRRDLLELPAPQKNNLRVAKKSPNDQVTDGTKKLCQLADKALKSMPESKDGN